MFLLTRRMRENRKVSIAKGQRQNGRQAAKPVTYLPNLMKKSHLVLTICLLTVVPTIAQERQRFFDNFDTARGVQVYRPEFVPVGAKSKQSSRLSKNSNFFEFFFVTRRRVCHSFTAFVTNSQIASLQPLSPLPNC